MVYLKKNKTSFFVYKMVFDLKLMFDNGVIFSFWEMKTRNLDFLEAKKLYFKMGMKLLIHFITALARDWWWSWRPFSSKPVTIGQHPLIVFIFLAFRIFLSFFLFSFRCISCIFHVYLGCIISLLNKISVTYKKNYYYLHYQCHALSQYEY